jgi:putative polymerase
MWLHASPIPRPGDPSAREKVARAAAADVARPHGLVERWSVCLVYAAALYPLFLCFVNTHVARMPNAAIIIAEVLIGLAAIPIIVARMNLGILLLCLVLCANFLLVSIAQQAMDVKALRDLLMPVVFVWLGYVISDRRISERVLRNLAFLAVVIGLVEFIFPTFYKSIFDTIAFYTSRGFGTNNPFQLTVLQTRPLGIGRSLLPFLGPRRISSLFLEPVALGNFAVLTAAWALSKPRQEWREAAWLLVFAAAMTIMADARFGSITIVVLLLVRLTNLWKLRVLAGLMPFAAMAILILVTIYGGGRIQDNLIGRMQISGSNLLSLPWDAWFGIPANISLDAGYGYIIQRTGIVICALLWLVFSILPLKDDQARCFHFSAAIYVSLNLCISGSSLFSLKTTAVLWLLLGTVIAHRSLFDRIRFYRIPGYDAPRRAVA